MDTVIRKSSGKSHNHLFKWWCTADFANSIFYTNLLLYFPTWFSSLSEGNEKKYNFAIIISTVASIVLTILLAPKGKTMIGRTKTFCIVSALLVASGLLVPALIFIPSEYQQICALIFFITINVLYLVSLASYDSMLGDFKSQNEYVSGSSNGMTMGWLGAITGVLIVGAFPSFNSIHERLISITLSWVPFAIISVFVIRAFITHLPKVDNQSNTLSNSSCSIKKQLKDAVKALPILFLISFLLYGDAIFTIQDNLSLYLHNGLKVNDREKIVIVIGIILAGIFGAWVSKLGTISFSTNKRLKVSVILTIFFTVLLSTGAGNKVVMISFVLLAFTAYGSALSLSRARVTELSEMSQRGWVFAFYSVIQRSGTLLGPFVWVWATSGNTNYSRAFISMAVLMMLGFVFLMFRRNKIAL